MSRSRIAALVTDHLGLREDSITRLAAQHISIKSVYLLSVHRSCVPSFVRYFAEYPDELSTLLTVT